MLLRAQVAAARWRVSSTGSTATTWYRGGRERAITQEVIPALEPTSTTIPGKDVTTDFRNASTGALKFGMVASATEYESRKSPRNLIPSNAVPMK
jgi:hypothetical protein